MVDGNEKIGMGHVMRCLTIAEALRKQGEEVLFLSADDKPVKIIEDQGFAVKILFTYYDELGQFHFHLIIIGEQNLYSKSPIFNYFYRLVIRC